MDLSEMFWQATAEEIKRGYVCRGDDLTCLICGKSLEKGVIYPEGDGFYEAETYMRRHIAAGHGSSFDYLIHLDKKYTGLSDIQKEYLIHAYHQCSDREIAGMMGTSESAVRNQRFKLRERAHQAKVFLALAMSLEEKEESSDAGKRLVTVHKRATMVDERYAVSQEEDRKIIASFFDETGHLREFPAKEKKKIVVLRQISAQLSPGRFYTEAEINRVLKRIYDDYATIRRELIEYGFWERARDCSRYWVKE